MLRLAALFGLLGLAAATAVIIGNGYQQIFDALGTAGWGIFWTSLFHLLPMLACVIGWQALMPGKKRPSLGFFFYILWLRSSVNNLLPVARIGGEVVAVRVMMKHGIKKSAAIASTVVELTTSVIAVFLFDVIGIGLFMVHVGNSALVWKLIGGLLLSIPPIAAMVAVQRFGFFGLLDRIFKTMIRDKWKNFMGSAALLDRAVHSTYRRYGRVLFCAFWQLVAWFLGVGEVWFGLYYLGHQLPLVECFMLEALIQASASAAFAVPGAIGVQEAGFLLFGRMLGLSPEVAVALALIRRCRDIMLYVPGLIYWQVQEGRWLMLAPKK